MAAIQVPIPQEIQLLALSNGLGQPVMGLRHEKTPYFLFGFITMLLLSLIMTAFVVIIVIYGFIVKISEGDASQAIAALWLALIAAGVEAGCLYVMFGHWRKLREIATERYYVFHDGFIIGQPGRCEVIAWRQVEAVYQLITRIHVNVIPIGTWARSRIHCTDGRKVMIYNRTQAARLLTEIIGRRVAETKLPQALSALNSGQTLDFGPFSLSIDGLRKRKGRANTLLPWRELGGVSVVSVNWPEVWIYRADKRQRLWARARPLAIPNYTLFMTLVERMARVN
ncbi:DUF6585 family protein [Thermogemmatispora tikiterensis]|uniref:Uncharacterized protein n=1 Tax=Thermogemmatispora tikiterensis TaxID=1825093 RepID=A0A328V8Z4_9CHLR|nr:DUF6585 family protein [Thermogemmatispora tikiterensis]RAQ94106.1 hypothetical protein A4R35_01085 [Thermogemmatispora tikiterensis]